MRRLFFLLFLMVSAMVAAPYNSLFVLISFTDVSVGIPRASFDSLLLMPGGRPTVAQYFSAWSRGAVEMQAPDGIISVTVSHEKSWYTNGEFGEGSAPHNSAALAVEVVGLLDLTIDFSVYDNDGDGAVDAIVFICPHYGAEATGDGYDFWSSTIWMPSPVAADGVIIGNFSIVPEYHRTTANIVRPSVICHEIGHQFGWPDLYGDGYPGLGLACLMSEGYGINGGYSPLSPSAYCLDFSGWVSKTTIRPPFEADLVIEPGIVYEIIPSDEIEERFLIQNLQGSFWPDSAIANPETFNFHGLLIFHIRDSILRENPYTPNFDSLRPGVQLERANGTWHGLPEYEPLPGAGGHTVFSASPADTPNSCFWNGDSSGFSITGIAENADGTVSCHLSLPSMGVAVAEQTQSAQVEAIKIFSQGFSLEAEGKVVIFDISGREVFSTFSRGYHGLDVESGVYLVRAVVDGAVTTKKVVIVK